MRSAAAVLGVVVASVITLAAPASAHADVSSIVPAACSRIEPGASVTIVFNEELLGDGSRIELVSNGATIATAGIDLTDIEHQTLALSVPADASGPITVSWTARSANDDDVSAGIYGLVANDDGAVDGCEPSSNEDNDSTSVPFALVGTLTALGAGALVLLSRQSRPVES